MARETVLVVDDEEDILELVRYNLARAGYQVRAVSSGEEALKTAREAPPDVLLLDLMLPGLDGLEVCRILKHDPRTQAVPVVILSARGEESDVVTGLELGADDYVTKPFSSRVLLARLKAVLRRAAHGDPEPDQVLHRGPLSIDPRRHQVLLGGQPLDLTLTEYRILHTLARRPGWVFTRAQIVEAVHDDDAWPVTDRSVDVHIVGLRRVLGEHAELIQTVRGVGYRFRE